MDKILLFHQVCTAFHGVPIDIKTHGKKFSKPYQPLNDEKSSLGTIHITVYLTSGRVLMQGSCYPLWHAEHLPHLMSMMMSDQAATPSLENRLHHAPKGDKPGTVVGNTASSYSVCDYEDTENVMLCDACEQWLHYACTKLFLEKTLSQLVEQKTSVYVCWNCQTPRESTSVVNLPAIENTPSVDSGPPSVDSGHITAAIQALERNIFDNINLTHVESLRNLTDKHSMELDLIRERHKTETKALK